MSKKIIDENLELLEELIRTASADLVGGDETMAFLQHKDLRDRLYGKFPECYMSIKRMGRVGRDSSTYMLPVCNRAGIADPKVIGMSIKVIQKLMSDSSGMYDVNDLKTILTKLQKKQSVYSKDIPKPPNQAGRKALVTRMFNNVKNHLQPTGK